MHRCYPVVSSDDLANVTRLRADGSVSGTKPLSR
jgi:hypothetical protein